MASKVWPCIDKLPKLCELNVYPCRIILNEGV